MTVIAMFASMRHAACVVLSTLMILPVAAQGETQAAPPASEPTFQEFGGKAGIGKVVDTLLVLVVADVRIAKHFKDADMRRLARMLTDQFCVLTGGPCTYEGADMKEAHDGMRLRNADFNALAENLQEAMIRNHVPPAAQYRLLGKLAPMQRDVVEK